MYNLGVKIITFSYKDQKENAKTRQKWKYITKEYFEKFCKLQNKLIELPNSHKT